MDFILVEATSQGRLDEAMSSVGFVRKMDRYVHPHVLFYVEFPRGPLAIGGDYRIKPVERRGRHGRALVLSATDSCRDRLAAFYHWNDRGSLDVAVAIALRNRVSLPIIQRWSQEEGFPAGFAEFALELKRARAARSRRLRPKSQGR